MGTIIIVFLEYNTLLFAKLVLWGHVRTLLGCPFQGEGVSFSISLFCNFEGKGDRAIEMKVSKTRGEGGRVAPGP